MNLYIQVNSEGQAVNHPIIDKNFHQAFPHIDPNNLPPEFARFERVAQPRLNSPYEKQRCVYERGADGVFRDVWYTDQMTPEEIKEKQDSVKQLWASNEQAPKSWVFNEEKCIFVPPLPYPTDGKRYRWDEPTVSWVEITITPVSV